MTNELVDLKHPVTSHGRRTDDYRRQWTTVSLSVLLKHNSTFQNNTWTTHQDMN